MQYSKPNIVFIITDQQRYDTISAAEQRSDALNSGLTETEFMTMVRSKDWKLVHYLGNESGELYDLKKDPNEQKNRWTDPKYNAKKEELLRALLNWRMRSDNNTADWPKPWR